ncbi:alpha/beta hydrolase [Dietzia cinnamea]|uniref:alpha/beta hydrolase n=1 Tax=Dietzia cinnamea TaxID=321318 RepID=UPI0021A88790|nr:alpha/beta hydrolase [Dietzia cinnamea]MCT2273883.1 alpha/beta hydrolase [Dietzia cinnamea]
MQPSSTFVGTTAVVGAIALLGTGVASATQVEWQDCTEMLGIEAEYVPAGLECGTVEVPVDYNAPDAAKTKVALTRIKASSGQARSTVFGNPGGPGTYALNFWNPAPDGSGPGGLYENHDLVAVQPRGLFGSNPMVCNVDFVGPNTVNALHDACYGTDPEYMASMTTENAARDMNAVREALELAEIDYVGVSYGTAIGTDFATLFPENTGRMVLDSNTHPDWRWSKQAEQGALAQERRVNDIFAWIAERDDYYGLGDTPLKVFHSWKWVTDQEVGGPANLTPPPAEARDLPVELRGTPVERPALDVINGTAPARARVEGFARAAALQGLTNNATTGLYDATVGATYSEQAWPMLAHILKYYNDGGTIARVDYETVGLMLAAQENRSPVYRTDVEMNSIVTCNETAAPADQLGVMSAKVDKFTGGNRLTTRAAVEAAGDDCVGWEPVARTISPNGDALDEKPLVLHSEDDAVTPIAGAHRVVEALGGALVTVGGGDHGTFRTGNEAVDKLVMDFLRTGVATPGRVDGKPSPEPLPRWGEAERIAAAQQGMSAPVAGADDWYGTHRDAGVGAGVTDAAGLGSVGAPATGSVGTPVDAPAPATGSLGAPAAPAAAPAAVSAPAPLPSPQQLQQQAEKAVQDFAGQVDAAARSLFAPFAPPTPPAQPQV